MPEIRLDTASDRARAIEAIRRAPAGSRVEIVGPKRSDAQNKIIWAMMNDVARQRPRGICYPPASWKAIFMSGLGIELELVRGLYGEPVPIDLSTSKMTRQQAAEFIEFTHWWCASKGIHLNEKTVA